MEVTHREDTLEVNLVVDMLLQDMVVLELALVQVVMELVEDSVLAASALVDSEVEPELSEDTEVMLVLVEVLEVLAATTTSPKDKLYTSTSTFMFLHQSLRSITHQDISQSPRPKSIIKSSSSRLHLLNPNNNKLSHNFLNTKKRP